jgi:hypothetical protein
MKMAAGQIAENQPGLVRTHPTQRRANERDRLARSIPQRAAARKAKPKAWTEVKPIKLARRNQPRVLQADKIRRSAGRNEDASLPPPQPHLCFRCIKASGPPRIDSIQSRQFSSLAPLSALGDATNPESSSTRAIVANVEPRRCRDHAEPPNRGSHPEVSAPSRSRMSSPSRRGGATRSHRTGDQSRGEPVVPVEGASSALPRPPAMADDARSPVKSAGRPRSGTPGSNGNGSRRDRPSTATSPKPSYARSPELNVKPGRPPLLRCLQLETDRHVPSARCPNTQEPAT